MKTLPYIIGVCGRSCSGKSTVVEVLGKSFPDLLVIKQDKFFKRSDSDEIHYWETLECLRNDRLIDSIKKLKRGESTSIPSRGWTEIFDRVVYPKKYIIVEGYLIFAIEELSVLFDKRVWIDVSDVNILYRRLKRDGDLRYIEKIMDPVIYQSKQYEPVQRSRADIIIDGNAGKDSVIEEFKRAVFG